MTADAERLAAIRSERIRAIRSRVVDLEGFPTSPRFGAGDMALVLAELDALRACIEAAPHDVWVCLSVDEAARATGRPCTCWKSAVLAGDQSEAAPEPVRVLMTHPHDGHAEGETCLACQPTPEPVRQLRECVVCGEKTTMSNATPAWEALHKHATPEPPHLDPEGSNG